ncbi:hypothetical protein [Oceanibaculum indicum]|uniref:Tail protein n=1 Tax=Oceanibaculum indicum TaxID=526216 RepID=A0A420WGG5_9PROT|nr:hypothetical protein [Oceanibaculum indicum]RKQ70114.1 hypothetical protein BCL74_2053 [Oceanibaculum indicum]
MTARRPRAGDVPRVLVRLDLLDPATGNVAPLRVATSDFADKISQSEVYKGTLSLAPVINRSVGIGSLFSGGGAATARMTIRNDGEYDQALTRFIWEGHPVQVYAGVIGQDFADYETIFTGTIQSVEWNWGEIEVSIEDILALLDREIQPNTFAGTGGYEGGADLAGIRKPICIGRPLNVPLVAINRSLSIYLAGDVSWSSVPITVDAPFLYDKGVARTDAGTSSDLITDQPLFGQYKTDPSRGAARLGGNIFGTVTADVEALASGSPPGTADAASASRIILASRGVNSPSLEIESFDALKAANNSDIGVYVPQGGLASEVLDTTLASVGAFRGTRGNGLVFVRRFEAPVASNPDDCDLALFEQDLIGSGPLPRLRRRLLQVPPWQFRVGYDRAWEVQPFNDLAASAVDVGRLDLVGTDYRYGEVSSTTVRDQHPASVPLTIAAGLRGKAAAEAEAARLSALIGIPRDVYICEVDLIPGTLSLGDQVWLQVSRFGLDRGKAFRVIAISESARTFRATLELFG